MNQMQREYIDRLPERERAWAVQYAEGPAQRRREMNWDGPSTTYTEQEIIRTVLDEMRDGRGDK